MVTLISSHPSAAYRGQIRTISAHMRELTTQTLLYPLHAMGAFNEASVQFNEIEKGAVLCCSVMDSASTAENENRATNAVSVLIRELAQLKNSATELVEDEPGEATERLKDPLW